MKTKMETLREVNGQLVSVTTDYLYPPIPYRGNDYCAHYTNDQSDQPSCAWGATAEEAIQNLVDSYDDPDAPITFEYEYECDLIADRLQENAYQYLYFQEYALHRRSHLIYGAI